MKKIRKVLLSISALFIGAGCVFGARTVNVSADEEVLSSELSVSESSELPTYTSTVRYETYYLNGENEVADKKFSRGDVILSHYEGNPGDVVTALVQSNPGFERDGSNIKTYKYLVKDVYFNGEKIFEVEPETGKYQFTLVEGENIFKVVFDGISNITSNDLLSIDWLSLLTVDNLLTLIAYLVMIGLTSGFFITLIKNKKIKSKTVEEIVEIVKNVSKTTLAEEAKEFIVAELKPVIDSMGKQYKTIATEMETLVKCTLLAQENTPESRLAITDELISMEKADQKLGDQVKEIINEAIKSQDEKKEALKNSIEEVKKSIADLTNNKNEETSQEEKEEASKGLI